MQNANEQGEILSPLLNEQKSGNFCKKNLECLEVT